MSEATPAPTPAPMAPIVDAVKTTGCRDGCGRKATDLELAAWGWERLPLHGMYRCTECRKALDAINFPEGKPDHETPAR